LIGLASVLVVGLVAVLVVVAGGDEKPETVASGDGRTSGAEGPGGAATSRDNETSTPATVTETSADPASTPSCVDQSDGVLQFAGLVTQTGDGAYFSAPRAAAIELAVQDVNEAGGVLGAPVGLTLLDTAGSADVALSNVDGAVASGADAFVLGFDEFDSYEVVEEAVVDACRVSAAPISWESTGICEAQLSFCTAPSSLLISRALAEVVIADGVDSVALLRTQYEEGDEADFVDAFIDQGGGEVYSEVYDPANVGTLPAEFVGGSGAGAVVVIGFDGVPDVLRSLFESGLTPQAGVPVYVLHAPLDDELAGVVPVGAMNGVRSIQPQSPSAEFAQRLRTINPDSYYTYLAEEAYDTVVVLALAAALAGTDEPSAVSAQVVEVTRTGVKCTSFGDCAALVAGGVDIDYDGLSGSMEFGPDGVGIDAVFGVVTYGATDTVDPSRAEAWYVAR
jgi:branched-chain amino acid transport system substrate-binding protein